MYIKTILFIFLLGSVNAHSVNFIEINTEFLWDSLAPHEGRIMKKSNAPTEKEYMAELDYYVGLIRSQKADVVGLTEIEGCHVSTKLASKLGNGWVSVCEKGRDTFTGQDVAILTTLEVLAGTVDNHKMSHSYISSGKKKGKLVRPSKALTVLLKNNSKTYMVTVAHLISRRGDNDGKRQAQAEAIKDAMNVKARRGKIDYQVIMGDINDYSNSKTIRILKGSSLKNPAKSNHCSYTYKGKCKLIDHILVSKNMRGEFKVIDIPKKYSDHSAVVFKN